AGTPLPNRPAGNPAPASGLGWWTNFDGVWAKVPRDAFAGAGAGNQVLLVVPSLDLIVVRNGSNLYDSSKGEGFWAGIEQYLFNPVIEAIATAGPPYPQSSVIKGVVWAPQEQIVRLASGSDNWPITWADDNSQYTAYGDGWGFVPKTEKKLSLGISRILGSPPDFGGVNVRTETSWSMACCICSSGIPAIRRLPSRAIMARPGRGAIGSSPKASVRRHS
ncbi:MAG: hypothetical protein ACYTAO_24030, partial [Planctomycetota bacterium]